MAQAKDKKAEDAQKAEGDSDRDQRREEVLRHVSRSIAEAATFNMDLNMMADHAAQAMPLLRKALELADTMNEWTPAELERAATSELHQQELRRFPNGRSAARQASDNLLRAELKDRIAQFAANYVIENGAGTNFIDATQEAMMSIARSP